VERVLHETDVDVATDEMTRCCGRISDDVDVMRQAFDALYKSQSK
jgi:hypothetical protein